MTPAKSILAFFICATVLIWIAGKTHFQGGIYTGVCWVTPNHKVGIEDSMLFWVQRSDLHSGYWGTPGLWSSSQALCEAERSETLWPTFDDSGYSDRKAHIPIAYPLAFFVFLLMAVFAIERLKPRHAPPIR